MKKGTIKKTLDSSIKNKPQIKYSVYVGVENWGFGFLPIWCSFNTKQEAKNHWQRVKNKKIKSTIE